MLKQTSGAARGQTNCQNNCESPESVGVSTKWPEFKVQTHEASTTLSPRLHLSSPFSVWTHDPQESNEASPGGDPDLTLTRAHKTERQMGCSTQQLSPTLSLMTYRSSSVRTCTQQPCRFSRITCLMQILHHYSEGWKSSIQAAAHRQ